MSQKGVSEVIGLLVVDSEFRRAFKEYPAACLAGFDLTNDERAALMKLKDKDLGSMSASDIAGSLSGTGTGNVLSPK